MPLLDDEGQPACDGSAVRINLKSNTNREVDMPAFIDFRIKVPLRDSSADPEVPLPADLDRYSALYAMHDRLNLTVEDLRRDMQKYDICGVLQTEFEDGANPRPLNERTAELLRRWPDLFLGGVPTADPRDDDAVEVLRSAHDDLGLRGLIIQPAFFGFSPADSRCYPLYEFCDERGVPVTIHTGTNFAATAKMDYGRPLWVDHVACDFPELTLVCNHGGWPWAMEAVAIAHRHENVYLEYGAIAPKYLADPRGGYGPVTHWMRTQIPDKILLGSDWPMLMYDRLIAELPLLELTEGAYEAYVRGNAQRIIDRVWPRTTGRVDTRSDGIAP
jgi:predicted TIM-barrel fold metal-dependent hydrolase